MGQTQSDNRQLTVNVVEYQRKDYVGVIIYLCFNFIFIGFGLGILLHEHELSILRHHYKHGFRFDIFIFLRGLQLVIHIISCYLVYAFFYLYLLEVILRHVIVNMVRLKYEQQVLMMSQLLYGMWVTGEIFGGWADVQNAADCMYHNDCRGFVLSRLLLIMKSVCEFFAGYDYNETWDMYTKNPRNNCVSLFHFVPGIMVSIVTCILAAISVMIAAPGI